MGDLVANVAGNIIANVVFWLGLGAAVWLVTWSTRRRFNRFFGLDDGRRISVYLSNASPPDAAHNQMRFAISFHEFQATQTIGRLVATSPMRLPEFVRGLVDGIWLGRNVQATFETPPINGHPVVGRTSIVVGAGSRNTVRAMYLDQPVPLPLLAVSHEGVGVRAHDSHTAVAPSVVVTRGDRAGTVLGLGSNVAVIEKVYDEVRKVTVFFCAGFRADATWAACEYLVQNWSLLSRRYGKKNFALWLEFPLDEVYMSSYTGPRRVEHVAA